ncbi:OLC1v1013047C1 [Oldenlandia corymbosa var. corymbosa]|uniref:OLC1v1013047C1 n=1 Tax=Oldenlandia corymbosa var. corymbosa TaxID=529605 RepID=A0AAV1DXB8_OLDCO|nr:OLC1v1013047C1 [Oldenlandia corymbosa var. corymbosa]
MEAKVFFDDDKPCHASIIHAIMEQVRCLMMIHDLKIQTEEEDSFSRKDFHVAVRRVGRPCVLHIMWYPPPLNAYILSTDGSSSLGEAGYGFVIQGGGSFIYGEGGYLGGGDSFLAEISGILFSLRKCEQLHLSNVEIQTDNQVFASTLAKNLEFCKIGHKEVDCRQEKTAKVQIDMTKSKEDNSNLDSDCLVVKAVSKPGKEADKEDVHCQISKNISAKQIIDNGETILLDENDDDVENVFTEGLIENQQPLVRMELEVDSSKKVAIDEVQKEDNNSNEQNS